MAKEEINSKDLEQIEDLLEHVAESKQGMKKEVDELKALKEDISEYKEVPTHFSCSLLTYISKLSKEEEKKMTWRIQGLLCIENVQ